jgi:hypothetical protein
MLGLAEVSDPEKVFRALGSAASTAGGRDAGKAIASSASMTKESVVDFMKVTRKCQGALLLSLGERAVKQALAVTVSRYGRDLCC